MQTTHAICHYCGLSCGVKVEIDDSGGHRRLVSLIGDKDDPAYHGYSCAKGRDLPELLRHPNRLLHPLKQNPGETGCSNSGGNHVLLSPPTPAHPLITSPRQMRFNEGSFHNSSHSSLNTASMFTQNFILGSTPCVQPIF